MKYTSINFLFILLDDDGFIIGVSSALQKKRIINEMLNF